MASKPPEGVDINYAYLCHHVRSLPDAKSLRILDYGCGGGDLVTLLLRSGYDAFGCDVFYSAGPDIRHPAIDRLIRAGRVVALTPGSRLPYPEGHFDVILSNQVFEHVADLEGVLASLASLLKPDGHLLAHFPAKEVIREGHVGIPFVHWFASGSRARSWYALCLRRLGLGYFKDTLTPSQWVREKLQWLDAYCHYRPYAEIRRMLDQRFEVTHHEAAYIQFRSRSRCLRYCLRSNTVRRLAARVFRRLAFMAVVLRPKARPLV